MWPDIIIEELVARGVSYFIISPGSRSTPLTLSVARHPAAAHAIAYDERGAAYHAVGYARATGRPAALICTSGTAAANYLPAVTEASNDALPLIAITADRPPELQGIGANQTIDQQNLYGGFVRAFVNLPPEEPGAGSAAPRDAVAEVLRSCLTPVPGPVHLNCMFREPFRLAPDGAGAPPARAVVGTPGWAAAEGPTAPAATGLPGSDRGTPRRMAAPASQQELDRLLALASPARRPMLIAGNLSAPTDRQAVATLARKLGWPLWADIRSGLRTEPGSIATTCALDRILAAPADNPSRHPDFILHLGGGFVSKRLLQYLQAAFAGTYCKVPGDGRALDPSRRCALTATGDVARVCDALSLRSAELPVPGLELDNPGAVQRLARALQAESGDEARLSEPAIGYLLSRHLSMAVGLFLGNSMPVRFCDRFAIATDLPTDIAANRGVSGIDGTLASALGYAAGLDRPVVCLLGDLSLIHDMSSLSQLAGASRPLVIIVVNNRGGGIFHHLPIAAQSDVFEPFFVTPHHYEFSGIARQFGLSYSRSETNGAFVAHLREALASGAPAILELTVGQDLNMAVYRRIEAAGGRAS